MKQILTILFLFLFSNFNFGQYNYSGLYTRLFTELDLKPDSSLTYDIGSGCGAPFFSTIGTWKKINDSTLILNYTKDASVHEFKIISTTEIAEANSKNFDSIPDKKGKQFYYTYYANSFIRTKGYYSNGKTEWEVDDEWETDYIYQRLRGPCIYYNENGIVKSKGLIRDGKREGKWICFDASGKKIKTEYYKNDLLVRTK